MLKTMTSALQYLVADLEQDRSLCEPSRLRDRVEALDHLETYLIDDQLPVFSDKSINDRARTIYDKLEAVNRKLYREIRGGIQRGEGCVSLLKWVNESSSVEGEGYDYLDDLISGILQFEIPDTVKIELTTEMVPYQPTPARHVFDMITRTALTDRDVLVDLGSGLGHVPLLVSICTDARCFGIELETTYVKCAQKTAQTLNLSNVTFIQQDARVADLSGGTVFYLYTPFIGTILRAVLDSLQQQAVSREIRVCTFGPCTPVVAKEPWLKSDRTPKVDRIAVFNSRN